MFNNKHDISLLVRETRKFAWYLVTVAIVFLRNDGFYVGNLCQEDLQTDTAMRERNIELNLKNFTRKRFMYTYNEYYV